MSPKRLKVALTLNQEETNRLLEAMRICEAVDNKRGNDPEALARWKAFEKIRAKIFEGASYP